MHMLIYQLNLHFILTSEKLNQKIPGFLKIFRDTSRANIEPESRELSHRLVSERAEQALPD